MFRQYRLLHKVCITLHITYLIQLTYRIIGMYGILTASKHEENEMVEFWASANSRGIDLLIRMMLQK